MFKLFKFLLACIVAISFFTNRVKVTYQFTDNEINVEPIKVNASFFVGGIFQTENKDVKNICNGKNVNKIEDFSSIIDNILTIVTVGIYNPKTILVYCN